MIAIPQLDFGSINRDAFRQRLRQAIEPFNEVEQSLKDRIVDYLISGHEVEVLLDFRDALRQPGRNRFFRSDAAYLMPVDFKHACQFLQLFCQPITPDGYYHRLGQVCSQYPELDRAWARSDPRLPKWFNDMMRLAIAIIRESFMHVPSSEMACDWQLIAPSLSADETEQFLRVLLDGVTGDNRSLGASLGYFARFRPCIEGHMDQLVSIVEPDTELQERLVRLIAHYSADPGPHFSEVIDYGLNISRKYKSDFQEILEKRRSAAKPILIERLRSGTALQRMRAAEWLNRLHGRAIATELAEALAKEKDKKVRELLEPLVAVYREAEEYQRALADQLTLPPVKIETGELPLPAGFARKFQAFLNDAMARSREQYRLAMQHHALQQSSDEKQPAARPVPPAPPTPDDLLALYLYMEGKSDTKPTTNAWLFRILQESPSVERWCEPRELKLLHVLRLLDAIGSLQERSSALAVYHFELLNAHRRAQEIPYGLREIDVALEYMLGRSHLMSRRYIMDAARYELEEAAIWPAYVDQLKLIEDSIAGVPLDQFDREVARRRQTALAIAGMLPVLPKQLEEAAWALALADGWTLRPLARPLLKRQPTCAQRAIAALKHRSGGARMGAAEILQELGATEAIEPLKKALNKEKFRPVQGYLLTALEKLGANVDEFIGRAKLLEDATKADKRTLRSMCWFPLDKLPEVRWANDNKPLPAIVVRWWMIQCVEFKSTTCSPVMRRALELCRRDDTLRLAHFILDQWINFDTDEPGRPELEARYRAKAQDLASVFKWAGKNTQKEMDAYVERMVKQELRDIQRAQSAHSERGLLAIVAAFGDAKCIDKMEKYIRNYHGNRALQAKSMLEVIPQIDDPNALRVIRSLAAGFRNQAICKRAGELFREMSERFGWSEDELAERILPDAGFAHPDEGLIGASPPEMILSYGVRQFRIIVNDDFEIAVNQADGTRTKDLPAATKDDDKTLVRVAKEQLKTSRQILRATHEQLVARLYEAMCHHRTWSVEDWLELLAGHVLAGIACRRLVWSIQSRRDTTATCFQWQADGTAVDASGQRVDLSVDACISVAHPDQMEPNAQQYWVSHFQAQGIRTLFPQTSQAISEQVGRRD